MADTRKDPNPYPAVGTKWTLSSWALGEEVIFEVTRWDGPVVDRLLRITHTSNGIGSADHINIRANKAREIWDDFVRQGLRPDGKCNITRGILTYE